MRKAVVLVVVASVLAGVTSLAQQAAPYYLTGNLKEAPGTVTTDKGDQRTTFSGMIGFKVIPTEKGLEFALFELSLVSKGVPTGRGETGVLGVNLIDDDIAWHDAKTGRASFAPTLTLHYELIDRVKGFRTTKAQPEGDVFAPFTETMTGKMSARFPEALKVAEKGSTYVDLEMTFDLSSSVVGSIRTVSLICRVVIDWTRFFTPALYLRIQPVFIGTGPTDATATGKNFPELMKRATELWNRCGSVRCIKFVVNDPIYLNKPAYKVLETEAEANSLRAEVSVADAVEVFVVDRMDFACSWGGGACFSSGTASAKIVSCDQQLAVPAPCPCTWCPATCPPCPPCQTGAVNYYHLAHELGHALNLDHPGQPYGLAAVTAGSNMEPSGFCCDNPNVQSAKNCRNASNPLLYWGTALCVGTPNIMD